MTRLRPWGEHHERSREQATHAGDFCRAGEGRWQAFPRQPGREFPLDPDRSKTYEGKRAVIDELLRPLFAQFSDRYTNTAHRFVAEGDCVVIECQGRVTTKSGKPYHNSYCWICRIADGKLQELTE